MKDYFNRLLKNFIQFIIVSLAITFVMALDGNLTSLLLGFGLAIIGVALISLVRPREIPYEEKINSRETIIYKKEEEAPHKAMFDNDSQKKALDTLAKIAADYGFTTPAVEPDRFGRLNFGYRTEEGEFKGICEISLPDPDTDPDSKDWEAIMTKITEDFERACKKAKGE